MDTAIDQGGRDRDEQQTLIVSPTHELVSVLVGSHWLAKFDLGRRWAILDKAVDFYPDLHAQSRCLLWLLLFLDKVLEIQSAEHWFVGP